MLEAPRGRGRGDPVTCPGRTCAIERTLGQLVRTTRSRDVPRWAASGSQLLSGRKTEMPAKACSQGGEADRLTPGSLGSLETAPLHILPLSHAPCPRGLRRPRDLRCYIRWSKSSRRGCLEVPAEWLWA